MNQVAQERKRKTRKRRVAGVIAQYIHELSERHREEAQAGRRRRLPQEAAAGQRA